MSKGFGVYRWYLQYDNNTIMYAFKRYKIARRAAAQLLKERGEIWIPKRNLSHWFLMHKEKS